MLSFSASNNDIYFMRVLPDGKILVNNNYSGIIMLGNDLEEIRRWSLFSDLLITSSWSDGKWVLLWCYENGCLILIDTTTGHFKIIPLKQLAEVMFSPVISWDSKTIYLYDYYGNAYEIDRERNMLSLSRARKYFPNFNSCEGSIFKMNSGGDMALYRKNQASIMLLNQAGEKIYEKNIDVGSHDFDAAKKFFLEVNEEWAMLSNREKEECIFPLEQHMFVRGGIIDRKKCTEVFLLSVDKSDVSHSSIQKFVYEDVAEVKV